MRLPASTLSDISREIGEYHKFIAEQQKRRLDDG